MHLPVTLSGALFYASCVLRSRFASGTFTTLLLPRPGYHPGWGLHTALSLLRLSHPDRCNRWLTLDRSLPLCGLFEASGPCQGPSLPPTASYFSRAGLLVLNVQASHLDIQNGDFSQPHAQGLAFRPPFFYQPAVPLASKDKEPGLINN